MPQSVPFLFATQSGNVPASELDNNFSAVQTSLAIELPLVGGATTDLGSVASNNIQITGNSSNITSFGSSAIVAQPVFFIRFTGTSNTIVASSSIITPGGISISVNQNDAFKCNYLGSGNWAVQPFLNSTATMPQRIKLSTNTSYYVATTGNDFNAGTSGSPWLTIQHAINYLQTNVDLAGLTATINVADGTYTGGASVIAPFTGGGLVQLVGNVTTPGNCIISTTSAPGILVENSALTVSGFKLQTTTSGNCLQAGLGGLIFINGAMNFAGCAGIHLLAQETGYINITSNYTVSGSANNHWYGETGRLNCVSQTVTLTGTPAFSSAFALVADCGVIVCNADTFTGSATGVRYIATSNGVINTGAGGSTYLPGNSGGSTSAGGQYI